MNFENKSGLAATIARTQLPYRDLTLVTVVLKASYEVAEDGSTRLLPEAEQVPVNEDDAQTAFGNIDGEVTPIKDGCDLGVMGSAYAPKGRPTPRMQVAVSVGSSFLRNLTVVGDRVWEAWDNELRPSAPVPFLEMPLIYQRAFGGLASTGEFESGYDDNPEGKGFVFLEEKARSSPLPNLEESDQLIKRWDDRPLPAGVAPLPRQSTIRIARGADVDLEAGVTQVKPTLFSWGHPRMRLDSYPADAWLLVQGMRPDGDFRVRLPRLQTRATIKLDDHEQSFALRPDTICVFPSYNRFFVLARTAFLYQFVARQQRLIKVDSLEADGKALLPPSIQTRVAQGETGWLTPQAAEQPIPFELVRELYPLRTIVERLPLVAPPVAQPLAGT